MGCGDGLIVCLFGCFGCFSCLVFVVVRNLYKMVVWFE